MQVIDGRERDAVRREQYVARFEDTGGRRGRLDALDLDAGPLRDPERTGESLVERPVAHGDAHERAPHAPARQKLADDPVGRVDRHAEAEPLGAEDDGGVDAHDPAARVDERAARVSRIQRDVALDHVVDEPPALRSHRPTEGAHDAGRDGEAEAERIADRDDELPDAQPRRAPERGVRRRRRVHSDDGEIRVRIGADDAGRVGRSVAQRNLEVARATDDVRVREHVAVGREDEPRSAPLFARARDADDGGAHLRHHARHGIGVRVERRVVGRRVGLIRPVRFVVARVVGEEIVHLLFDAHGFPSLQVSAKRSSGRVPRP